MNANPIIYELISKETLTQKHAAGDNILQILICLLHLLFDVLLIRVIHLEFS